MRKLYLAIGAAALLFSTYSFAQTTHDVTLSGMQFSPADLDIEAGDIVRWTNEGGFHSVDGSADAYPDNPEAFGNDAGGAGWVYEFTFNTPGEYEYRCGIHTSTMFGSITVGETVGVEDTEQSDALTFYPNPVVDQINWQWNDNQSASQPVFTLFTVNGQLVDQFQLNNKGSRDLSHLSAGIYFYSVDEGKTRIQSGKILIDGQ